MEPRKPYHGHKKTPRDYTNLPHDGQNERDLIMREKLNNWKSKTILRSRTIVSVAVTILAFVLTKFFGLDVDLGSIVGAADGLQLEELILVVGAVVAAYFRKNLKTDLTTPGVGGAPNNG